MRGLAHVHDGFQLAGLGVDHHDLVGRIGGRQEVAAGRVEATVVQELGGVDLRRLQVLQVGVVDHPDLAGFLGVDQEFGLLVAGHDGGHARLGVVFVVDVHATRADDLARLERVTVHQHELRRPVGTGDRHLVFPALEFAGLDRARFQSNLDFSHVVGLFHPQVDQVQTGVAADHVQVAPRSRQARDVHRVAGLDDVDDLLGVAVDQRHLAGITQGDRHDVVDVVVVHLLLGTLRHRHVFLARLLHVLQREFGRRRRVVLDVAGHQVDRLFVHFAAGQPVRHAGRRTVGNEDFQVLGAFADGQVGRQRLAGGALAQHAVATSAALEVDLAGAGEFGLRHGRRLGVAGLVHGRRVDRIGRALVLGFSAGGRGGGAARLRGFAARLGVCTADTEQQRRAQYGSQRRKFGLPLEGVHHVVPCHRSSRIRGPGDGCWISLPVSAILQAQPGLNLDLVQIACIARRWGTGRVSLSRRSRASAGAATARPPGRPA